MLQATEFASDFDEYAYLWLDDRISYMQQFLEYGRQLTQEELELMGMEECEQFPESSPPNMDLFKEQVRIFIFVKKKRKNIIDHKNVFIY